MISATLELAPSISDWSEMLSIFLRPRRRITARTWSFLRTSTAMSEYS